MKGISIAEFTGDADRARAAVDQVAGKFTERERRWWGGWWKRSRTGCEFLCAVGLDYLSLERSSATLSGGEAQRIRLATQIGSKLRGVLYVLDEPSIGLASARQRAAARTLHHLRDLGNTVLVVEHDAETIERADYVIDLGPRAGRLGGELIAQGSPAQIMSVTAIADRQNICPGVWRSRSSLVRRTGNGLKVDVSKARASTT